MNSFMKSYSTYIDNDYGVEYEKGFLSGYMAGQASSTNLPSIPPDDTLPMSYMQSLYSTHHYGQNQEDTWTTYVKLCNEDNDITCSFKIYRLIENCYSTIDLLKPKYKIEKNPPLQHVIDYINSTQKISELRGRLVDLVLYLKRIRSINKNAMDLNENPACLMFLLTKKIDKFNESCKEITLRYSNVKNDEKYLYIDPDYHFFRNIDDQ